MAFESTPTKSKKTKDVINDDFHSTYVSSPAQDIVRKGKKLGSKARLVVVDDEDEDDISQNADSFGFMPVRGSTRKRKSDGPMELETIREKRIRPITISQDPIQSNMNPYEQDILDRFMKEAKRVRENVIIVRIPKQLRC